METKPFNIQAAKNGAEVVFVYPAIIGIGPIVAKIIHYDPLVALIGEGPDRFSSILSDTGEKIVPNPFGNPGETMTASLLILCQRKLASDLSGIKRGDKIWDMAEGWGEIVEIEPTGLIIKFSDRMEAFTMDGHALKPGTQTPNQTLFLAEIHFEIPEIE